MNVQGNENKSSTGLEPNVAALLAYLFGWVGGLVFFLIEKDSMYVKFHAMQSIFLNGLIVALFIVLQIFTILLAFISSSLALIGSLGWLVIGLGGLAVWVLMMIKAYQGEAYKLPVIGDMAENIVNK
ncbi:MAG: DUF4870 domain-containing protein [Thermoleophilia bacterium]